MKKRMLNNTIMARSPSKKLPSTPVGSPAGSPIKSPTEVIQTPIDSPTEKTANLSEADVLKKCLNEQTYLTKYVQDYNEYLSTLRK